MVSCPHCQKPIKYIVSKDGTIITVDSAIKTLVNEHGRLIHGYQIHVCSKSDNEQQESVGK
ncbi:hypothetical protein [Treponema pedis]|uniref:hypothetical protein n=1 Tax=Treponema pedis TaxID=409322 RepID=UPI0003FE66A9|nr:hypothetical protein [Treponema pedis]